MKLNKSYENKKHEKTQHWLLSDDGKNRDQFVNMRKLGCKYFIWFIYFARAIKFEILYY